MHAEPVLDIHRGRGKGVVWGRCRQHDHVDVGRRQTGAVERGARRGLAQRGRRLVIGRDVALANAGALDDPFIGSFDHAFEVGILHDAAGQRGTVAAHD